MSVYLTEAPVNAISNDKNIVNMFLRYEENIQALVKKDQTSPIYKTFFEYFSGFLSKLPSSSTVAKVVDKLLLDKVIYIGTSISPNPGIPARLVISNNVLRAIILDAGMLGIDPRTGECNRPDDAVYASYFGAIRASLLTKVDSVITDRTLHKYAILYLTSIFRRILKKKVIMSDDQYEKLLILTGVLMFNSYFRNMTITKALANVKLAFGNKLNDELFTSFSKELRANLKESQAFLKNTGELIEKFNIVKLPSSSFFIQELLKTLGQANMYLLLFSFDSLIAMAITALYPTHFIKPNTLTNERFQQEIEKYVYTHYLTHLKTKPL